MYYIFIYYTLKMEKMQLFFNRIKKVSACKYLLDDRKCKNGFAILGTIKYNG